MHTGLKLAAGTALVLIANAAFAAGPTIPYVEPPVAPPAELWEGFYVGASLGFGGGDTEFDFVGIGLSAPHSISGGFAGVYAGYDWQSGSNVFGVDLSYHISGIAGETPCRPALLGTCESSIESFGALRGRFGRVVGDEDDSLIYVAGGYAFAEATADVIEAGVIPLFPDNSASLDGWTAAVGFERMTSNGWTMRGEIGFTDYSPTDPGEIVADIGNPFELDINMVTVTLGFAKRF